MLSPLVKARTISSALLIVLKRIEQSVALLQEDDMMVQAALPKDLKSIILYEAPQIIWSRNKAGTR